MFSEWLEFAETDLVFSIGVIEDNDDKTADNNDTSAIFVIASNTYIHLSSDNFIIPVFKDSDFNATNRDNIGIITIWH